MFYGGKEYVVESLRAVNGGALIKLQGIDTPEAANASAQASPKPLPAPVTSTSFPYRFFKTITPVSKK